MTRVVLADDHSFIRTGIRNILQKTPDIIVVGEAQDGFQALALADELEPDVLLLDIEMPGMKGTEVASKLQNEGSNIPILVLSAYEDKQFILAMLANGAAGYLVKEEVPETIVNAIRGVARGERGWVSARVAARIALWLYDEDPVRFHMEPENVVVLRHIVEGKRISEVASSTELPEDEIDTRLDEITQAVRAALEDG